MSIRNRTGLVHAAAGVLLAAGHAHAQAPLGFTYEVVAKVGDASLTGFDGAPSINNLGDITFVGITGAGESVFLAQGAGTAPQRIGFSPSSSRDYFLTQFNDDYFSLSRDRLPGSPPFTFVRLWNANLPGDFEIVAEGSGDVGADFDSVTGNASVNNLNDSVFVAIDGSDTVLAQPGILGFSTITLPNGSGLPMMDDKGRVVVRMGSNTAFPIQLWNDGFSGAATIASTAGASPDFTECGRSPAISDDGRAIAFYGSLTPTGAVTLTAAQAAIVFSDGTKPKLADLHTGPGIFIAADTEKGWIIQRVAGVSGNGFLDPGETYVDANGNGKFDPGEVDSGPYASFEERPRLGANSFGLKQWNAQVLFIATATGSGARSIFAVRAADFRGGPDAPADKPRSILVGFPLTVARTGQVISGIGTVTALDLHDPTNTAGEVAFFADNGAGGTVVRAKVDDTDGDGLLDAWEIAGGIDADADGTLDLVLPESPDFKRKDLYVEVDSMTGFDPAIYADAGAMAAITAAGMTPTVTGLDLATQAFLNSPVTNPSGVSGVRLHVFIDETNIGPASWPDPWAGFNPAKALKFGTPAERGDPKKIAAKRLAYRYCIFAREINGDSTSGIAELPGNDFIVSLGLWSLGTLSADLRAQTEAGTFMHEMGHTLGLRHGGGQYDSSSDRRYNYKPNYRSIMNYTWQTPSTGYTRSWVLDYSREVLPPLNEASLGEPSGIGGRVGKFVPIGPPTCTLQPESGPIDYNGDGDEMDTGIARDLNFLFSSDPASPGDVLQGFNDWPALVYNFRDSPDFADGVQTTADAQPEITQEVQQALDDIPAPGCRADCNKDGKLNVNDFICFQSEWRKKSAYGDYNGDGKWNINDFIAYQADFRKGCT